MRVIVLSLVLLLAPGCVLKDFEPPKTYIVEVLGGGDFTFNGTPMDKRGVERQLRSIAEAHRHPTTGAVHKVHIHIRADKGSANAQARDLGSLCSRSGLNIVVYETL